METSQGRSIERTPLMVLKGQVESKPHIVTPRPEALPVQAHNVPATLRDIDAWLVWRYEFRKGKWTKPPSDAKTGFAGKSTDSSTWTTFTDAHDAYRTASKWDGIGFVHTPENNLTALDLDHCRDRRTGVIQPWAARIVEELDSYTEVSPSGTGLRIFCRGRKPDNEEISKGGYPDHEGGQTGKLEMYDGRTKAGKPGGRYLTLTGQRLEGAPAEIHDRTEQIKAIYVRELKEAKPEPPPPDANGRAHSGTTAKAKKRWQFPDGPLTDEDIITIAENGRIDPKLSRLWDGDTSGHGNDDSRADAALCEKLLYWIGSADTSRADKLFRKSKLFRYKWDEDRGNSTYGADTLAFAAGKITAFHEPKKDKTDDEPPKTWTLGGVKLLPEKGRRSASGKLTVPIVVLRGSQEVDRIPLPETASQRRPVAKLLLTYAGDTPPSIDSAMATLGEILIAARKALDGVQQDEGPKVWDLVAEKVPGALQLVCRTTKGLWSEGRGGEITRSDFVSFTPPWLIEHAGQGSDAPRDANLVPIGPDVLKIVKTGLEVLWADLYERLPTLSGADLGKATVAGQDFRNRIRRIWEAFCTGETFKGPSGEAIPIQANLLRKVKQKAQPYLTGGMNAGSRLKWEQVHPSMSAWWRPGVTKDGEVTVWLAMRWELSHHARVELPGVASQEDLHAIGEKFGVFNREPGVSGRLSGGAGRLAVLDHDFAMELLAEPEDDASPEPEAAEPQNDVQ